MKEIEVAAEHKQEVWQLWEDGLRKWETRWLCPIRVARVPPSLN